MSSDRSKPKQGKGASGTQESPHAGTNPLFSLLTSNYSRSSPDTKDRHDLDRYGSLNSQLVRHVCLRSSGATVRWLERMAGAYSIYLAAPVALAAAFTLALRFFTSAL